MIIVVSDVHLGWEDNTENIKKQDEFLNFLNFCDTDKIDHFVLLGDIFDFWARSNASIFSSTSNDPKIQAMVQTNSEIFKKLRALSAKKTHFVVGNHDYFITELCSRTEKFPFQPVKSLRLQDGGKNFFFTHGYDLDVLATMEPFKISVDSYEKSSISLSYLTDKTGWLAVNAWGLSDKIAGYSEALRYMMTDHAEKTSQFQAIEALANSPAAGLFLGMQPSENLVYGHTHRPYYFEQSPGGYMVANSGCWAGKKSRDDVGVNTFVKIDDGKMSLVPFNGKDIFLGS
jgi:UDP-2,3-diacylglucosamine pyrophosphatase LpxH